MAFFLQRYGPQEPGECDNAEAPQIYICKYSGALIFSYFSEC